MIHNGTGRERHNGLIQHHSGLNSQYFAYLIQHCSRPQVLLLGAQMFRFPISPTSLSGMLFSSPQLRETPQSQSQQIGEKNEALNDFAANIYFSEKRIML